MLINIDGYTIETKEIISVSKVDKVPSKWDVYFNILFTNRKNITIIKRTICSTNEEAVKQFKTNRVSLTKSREELIKYWDKDPMTIPQIII